MPIIYNTSDGTWSTPRNCRWECDEGFVENGGKCDEVPDSVVGKCGTEDYYSCDA